MAGITSIGVGSNLDLEGLLNNLIAAERAPTESRLVVREARIQANVSAFGNLKSALSKLQSSLAGLRDAAGLDARSATSSDATLFSAVAQPQAAQGSYAVQVLNLAKAQKLVSTDFSDGGAAVGAGTLTISSGSESFNVSATTSTTLTELRDSINNAAGNSSTTATLLTVDDGLGGGGTVTKLVLSARATGSANAIAIAVADNDGQNSDNLGLSRFFYSSGNPQNQLSQLQQAVDARISVDGFTAYSASNSFSEVIDGVTITALREPAIPLTPESATLSVSLNKGSVTARVQEFVKAYNESRKAISDLTRYDAASGAAGPLLGDASVRNIESGLRRILGDSVDGTEVFSSLSSIGVSTERDGTLSVNNAKLNAAIDRSFNDVVAIFSSDDGVATRLADALGNYLDSSGVISNRSDGFDKQLREIQDQRDALELRITAIEKRYRQQFTALDQLVSRLKSSGDFLLQQLDSTSRIINGQSNN